MRFLIFSTGAMIALANVTTQSFRGPVPRFLNTSRSLNNTAADQYVDHMEAIVHKGNDNIITSKHSHSTFSTTANLNTASTFAVNSQISTPQSTQGGWQLYYLDRLNIDCLGLGLNSFILVIDSGSNWWYNYMCVTPGFTSTTTTYSNLVAVQGGQIPVYNIKFFQYLTPNIADCSSTGGAITQLQFQSANSYATSGFAYQCGVFGSFSLSNCRSVTNSAQSVGTTTYSSGNANFLDRELVACNSNEALQTISWTYNGDTAASGQYVYTCCQYVPSCQYNYYISSGNCVSCPAGKSSSGGASTTCYNTIQPIQFNQQPQFSTAQQISGSSSLYYIDRINMNCNGLGINYFLFQNAYGSTNYGWYIMNCASPGFAATASYSYTNVVPVQGGTVPVLNIKHFQYLTPSIADCSSVGGAITQMQFQSQNSYASSGYVYTCGVFGSFTLSSCRTVTNAAQSIGATSWGVGNSNFLDREPVACNSNEALQTISWTYNGDTAASGQYVYTCCQYQPSCPVNTYFTNGVCNPCATGYQSTGGISSYCYPQPSANPSSIPSLTPTKTPTLIPSMIPTRRPSFTPTVSPTVTPSKIPTLNPSSQPTSQPSRQPTMQPSGQPSKQPSGQPSSQPSSKPSLQPISQPSSKPTSQPVRNPTSQPSSPPTTQPSSKPSCQPSSGPTTQPTSQPIKSPSCQPSSGPTTQPTSQPIKSPSCQPSSGPTTQPTSQPIKSPTSQPNSKLTTQPSSQPISRPTSQPSSKPSSQPSAQPVKVPPSQPLSQPTSQPSWKQTTQLSLCPIGTYNNHHSPGGTSTCLPCAAGTYANAMTGATTCLLCPSGQYVSAGATVCTLCPAGLFASSASFSACNPCLPGTFSTSGSSACQSCPVHTSSSAFAHNCSSSVQ